MKTTYQVNGLDADKCTLVSREAYTLKAARAEAKIIRTDQEFIDSGLVRVEIREDLTGDCVADWVVAPPAAKAPAAAATPARIAFEALICAALNMIDAEGLTEQQAALAGEIYEVCNRLEYTFDVDAEVSA